MTNPSPLPSAPPSGIQAVNGAAALAKGLALLQTIAHSETPLRFTDLLQLSGLPKGTLHRLLAALSAERLIRLHADQTYRLGTGLLELARRAWSDLDIREAAGPSLRALHAQTGETVYLAVYGEGEVTFIERIESPHPIRMYAAIGRQASLHSSALGKAILAHLFPEERDGLLAQHPPVRHTPRTITDPGELSEHLLAVRRRGYATQDGEHEAHIRAAAAPILDYRGRPVAAIGVAAPDFRLPLDRLETYGEAVRQAAQEITHQIGGVAP